MPILLGALASAIRKRFYDNFAGRVNTTGNLGTATDGSQWTAVNGIIQVTSGAATATTTPNSGGSGSTYPMSVVNMPTTDNIVEVTGSGQGSSVAIWVQSSSDWWMVDVDSTFNTVPGNTGSGTAQFAYYTIPGYYNGYTSPGYYNGYTTPGYTNPSTYAGGGYIGGAVYSADSTGNSGFSYSNGTPYFHYVLNGNYSVGYSYIGPSPYYYVAGNANSPTYNPGNLNSPTYNPGTLNSDTLGGGNWYTYYYTNATTYAYSEILRITQSVASVVNTIASSVVSTTQAIGSFRVKTKGNQITAQAFLDNSLVTQLGSDLVYTATGATIGTQYGIAISPSAYQQSAIIGTSVKVTRN